MDPGLFFDAQSWLQYTNQGAVTRISESFVFRPVLQSQAACKVLFDDVPIRFCSSSLPVHHESHEFDDSSK